MNQTFLHFVQTDLNKVVARPQCAQVVDALQVVQLGDTSSIIAS